jgi:hypothetical protein
MDSRRGKINRAIAMVQSFSSADSPQLRQVKVAVTE